jgi:peptidoglycan-N-acetylglucosamine deacetylase
MVAVDAQDSASVRRRLAFTAIAALTLVAAATTLTAIGRHLGADHAPSAAQAQGKSRDGSATRLPTGCTRGGSHFHTHGPRGKKSIAIGFDDGPGDYTSRILAVLRRYGAHATFFEIGQETDGRHAIMRSVLAEGSEIGNHSLHHELDPSSASLHETDRLIRLATGFRPCDFRAPDGKANPDLIKRASREGLETIKWDVDPRDWADPGIHAIASAVIHEAENGSIVVMHDGGGNRDQTLAALPAILSHFTHRGYRFVTVAELLGHQFIY